MSKVDTLASGPSMKQFWESKYHTWKQRVSALERASTPVDSLWLPSFASDIYLTWLEPSVCPNLKLKTCLKGCSIKTYGQSKPLVLHAYIRLCKHFGDAMVHKLWRWDRAYTLGKYAQLLSEGVQQWTWKIRIAKSSKPRVGLINSKYLLCPLLAFFCLPCPFLAARLDSRCCLKLCWYFDSWRLRPMRWPCTFCCTLENTLWMSSLGRRLRLCKTSLPCAQLWHTKKPTSVVPDTRDEIWSS